MPENGYDLMEAVWHGFDLDCILDTLVRGCKACKRASIEGRVLRAVLASCCGNDKFDQVLQDGTDSSTEHVGSGGSSEATAGGGTVE